jgi:hypothetical protein
VLDAETIFQDCAIILLSAEFNRKDVSVGYCGCDYQLYVLEVRESSIFTSGLPKVAVNNVCLSTALCVFDRNSHLLDAMSKTIEAIN